MCSQYISRILFISLLLILLLLHRSSAFHLHASHDGAARGVQIGHLEQIFAAVFGRPEAATVGDELGWEAAALRLLLSGLRELHEVALLETQLLRGRWNFRFGAEYYRKAWRLMGTLSLSIWFSLLRNLTCP